MACALNYLGASTDQLEGAVFQQQDALWALAQQALGYQVGSVTYTPPNGLSGESSQNDQRGEWLEPDEPTAPELSGLSLPPFSPAEVSIDLDVRSIDIPSRGNPQLSIGTPDTPGAFSEAPPEAPSLVEPDIEGAGELLVIAEAILSELNVPSIISLTVPPEIESPPDLAIDIHTQSVNYVGSDYTPSSALIAKIMEWLQGGSRMPDAIWSMVIDKAMSEAWMKAKTDSEQALNACAAKGWDFVTGPADKQIRQIRYGLLSLEGDKIGEILAQQAKQELENLQLAMAQGTALEGQLVSAWNRERMRELSAAKATVKLAVDAIDVKAALVEARTERYLAQAQDYATTVRAAVLPYRRYAMEVEAQEINAIQDKNVTSKYVAELKNLLPFAKKFAAEMRALRIIAEHNKNLAARYRTEVAAGAKQYLANEEEWTGLLAMYELPKLEAERHRLLSDSFAERTRAWLAGVELEGMKVRADTARKRGKNQEVEQDIRRFLEEVAAKQTEMEHTSRQWSAFYGVYDEYYSAWSSAFGVNEANQRADLAGKVLAINAKIAKLREDLEILSTQKRLQIEQDGGNAEIKTNLAAAMQNIIHVSASVGSSQSIKAASTCETTTS